MINYVIIKKLIIIQFKTVFTPYLASKSQSIKNQLDIFTLTK